MGVFKCSVLFWFMLLSLTVVTLARKTVRSRGKDPNREVGLQPFQPEPRLTKDCKAKSICYVLCVDCFPCSNSTGSCKMVLMKDGKMVASNTSVSLDNHIFKSSFKISIDAFEDFGTYNCVLKQKVYDRVDGSMFKRSINGRLLHLPRPKAFIKNPAVAIKADKALFSCRYQESLMSASFHPWEIVLKKDGNNMASNASLSARNKTVEGSFSLNNTLDVYGRYKCILRPREYDCIKKSWFNIVRLEPGYDSLHYHTPFLVAAGISKKFGHTCLFRVEAEDEDTYEIILTLNGKEVQRLNAELNPTNETKLKDALANFKIEVKDKSSFGLYDCALVKNGIPGKDVYFGCKTNVVININMLQLYPMRNKTCEEQNITQVSLGNSMAIPCSTKFKGAITGTNDSEVSHIAWYRDGVEITDDDEHTSLKGQRFRSEDDWTLFLWCTVTPKTADAYGKYECRFRNDTKSNGSMTTLRTVYVEPHSWKYQAQEYYDRLDRLLYDELPQNCEETLKLIGALEDTARTWKSSATHSRLLLGALSTAVFISLCIVSFVVIKRKLDIRDIHITLQNIHQMTAFGEGSTEDCHRYDVFISYSSADASWVRGDLLDNLESNGYTVCLDTRDFSLGKPILTNIATAIYQSRKVILVMSKNFIKSGWCRHELVLTYQRKLDQKENCVVVIKYDDCKIPKEIALRTYLDWTEPMARESFWAKLHEWLGPPLDMCSEEEDVEEVEEWFECQDSETFQQDGGEPTDTKESDDFVLRHRQKMSDIGCD